MSQVFRNTLSNVAAFAVRVTITLVMTPIYLEELGNHDYGVWEIMVATVGYLGILDLGFRTAIARFVAFYTATGSPLDRQRLYSTSLLSLGVIGFTASLLLIGWALSFPDAIAPPQAETERYAWVIILFAATVAVSFPGYTLESFLEGRQQYVLKNNVGVVLSILMAVAFVVLRDEYEPLLVLAAATAVCSLVQFVLFAVLLAMSEDRLSILFRGATISQAKELFHFGLKSAIQGVAGTVKMRSGVIIIGAVLGPAQVVYYSIPAALMFHVRGLLWTLSAPLMPAFTDLNATSDRVQALSLYRSASRLILALFLPLIIGGCFLGADFIALWLGEEYKHTSQMILPMLLSTLAVQNLLPLASRYLTALNQHGIFARIYPLEAAVHVLLTLSLVSQFGIIGVASAGLIASVTFLPLIARAVGTRMNYPFLNYASECLLPLLFPCLVLILVLVLARAQLKGDSFVSITVIASLAVIAYLLALALFSPKEDTQLVLGVLSEIRRGKERVAGKPS